jgi:hypothetical protein
MRDRAPFHPLQAQEVARAFNAAGVDYMFLGKSAAILLGFPGTTQDVDIYPARSEENGRRMVTALLSLGFVLEQSTRDDILRGRDFVQLKNGPFDLDLVFAPDGIENYAVAKARCVHEGIFPVANLRDIIASKRATGRKKDKLDLELLELFAAEYEARHP